MKKYFDWLESYEYAPTDVIADYQYYYTLPNGTDVFFDLKETTRGALSYISAHSNMQLHIQIDEGIQMEVQRKPIYKHEWILESEYILRQLRGEYSGHSTKTIKS